MITVFLSGSRTISRLPQPVVERLTNIVANGYSVVTGDANGADKAMQRFLAGASYGPVTIYHVGAAPRNNLGGWEARNVPVEKGLRGRDFFAQKDKYMASFADYGLVLWDGKSPGSVQNMVWLVTRNKKSVVFLNSIKQFFIVREVCDLVKLLNLINPSDLVSIQRKIDLSQIGPERRPQQNDLLL